MQKWPSVKWRWWRDAGKGISTSHNKAATTLPRPFCKLHKTHSWAGKIQKLKQYQPAADNGMIPSYTASAFSWFPLYLTELNSVLTAPGDMLVTLTSVSTRSCLQPSTIMPWWHLDILESQDVLLTANFTKRGQESNSISSKRAALNFSLIISGLLSFSSSIHFSGLGSKHSSSPLVQGLIGLAPSKRQDVQW